MCRERDWCFRRSKNTLIYEAVPSVAAVSDNVVVVSEQSVGEAVVAHELPDVFHDVQLGHFSGYSDDKAITRLRDTRHLFCQTSRDGQIGTSY